jgi:hypothetical protein
MNVEGAYEKCKIVIMETLCQQIMLKLLIWLIDLLIVFVWLIVV